MNARGNSLLVEEKERNKVFVYDCFPPPIKLKVNLDTINVMVENRKTKSDAQYKCWKEITWKPV